MLAAWSFDSAFDLSEFCARHRIDEGDTYTVLQSMVPCSNRYPFDGGHSVSLCLTLVLRMQGHELERIKDHEATYWQAYREQLRREEEGPPGSQQGAGPDDDSSS